MLMSSDTPASASRRLCGRQAFAEPVAQTVRCDGVEDLPGGAAVLFDAERGLILGQAVCLELGERRGRAVDLERAAVLRRIAAVFSQADLDAVSREDRRFVRRLAPRRDAKPHDRFVERY